MDPTPNPSGQPASPACITDLQYIPAPYLLSISFMDAANLAYYYKDFYISLKYVQSAPEIVYERLVANLSTVFRTILEKEGDEVRNSSATCNCGGSGQQSVEMEELMLRMARERNEQAEYLAVMKSEYTALQSANDHLTRDLVELRSEIEIERKKQIYDLEKYENEKKALQLSHDQLRVAFTELQKSTEIERQQQAISLQGLNDSNTILQALNNRLKADITELRLIEGCESSENVLQSPGGAPDMELVLDPLRRKNPEIGTFHTSEVQSHNQSVGTIEFVKAVSFATPYIQAPEIPLGLTSFHSQNTFYACVLLHPSTTRNDGFQIHVNGPKNIYDVGATWLEVEKNDPDFQCGEVYKRNIETNYFVTFPRPYTKPPRVLVWLHYFNINSGKDWSLHAYAADVTATGFTAHIKTWESSEIHLASVSWVACAADKTGVFSGSFNTLDTVQPDSPLPTNQGYVEFGSGMFSFPPRVVMAVNRIEMDCRKGLHFTLSIADITTTGMRWCVNDFPKDSNSCLEASFFALDS